MNQQAPAAVNGASNGVVPLPRKKPAVGASSLFKPTNNQKKRYPLGAPPKAPPKPPSRQTPNSLPDLSTVSTYANSRIEEASTKGKTTTEGPVKEYKLVTSKRDLLEGLRYHLLQLDDKVPLDIRKESDFTKPARLHRRNPDWKAQVKDDGAGTNEPQDAETEALNKRREARQKEREANLAQIAPSANTKNRRLFSKKKTEQVFHKPKTEEEKRRIQMNYEEKLPWVLEDFDSKHTLVGKHNQGSVGVYIALAYEQGAEGPQFRLLPVEKTYRFSKPSQLQEDMDWDTFNKALKREQKFNSSIDPESILRKEEERRAQDQREREATFSHKLYVADQSLRNTRANEDGDLDFDEDFADDEEGDLFGDKDEDEKAAEKKVKEDHLRANIGWQEKDEREIDEMEKREDLEEALKGKWGGAMRKKLEKRERNFNLGSDSDEDSSSDSEEERLKLEAEKQANLKAEEDFGKSAISSGANTPSGRREKYPASDREGGIKKSNSSKTLKRPGSPNLSDASGTDASTVRKKKKRHHSSTQPTPGGSRPMSPDGQRLRGQGSDSEGAAMSDGTRVKLKLKRPGSPKQSPPGSRAGSPAPNTERRSLDVGALPTADEIRARIPPEGVPMKDFLGWYKNPTDPERKAMWSALMRKTLRSKDGRIWLREPAAQQGDAPATVVKTENGSAAS